MFLLVFRKGTPYLFTALRWSLVYIYISEFATVWDGISKLRNCSLLKCIQALLMEENTGLLSSHFCANFHTFGIKSNQASPFLKISAVAFPAEEKRLELTAGELWDLLFRKKSCNAVLADSNLFSSAWQNSFCLISFTYWMCLTTF